MATVEFILALERRMELVPLRKGWWIAFGAPRQTAAVQERSVPHDDALEAGGPPTEATEPCAGAETERPGARRQHAGSTPPAEPKRRGGREPQPPTPRPMPDPAPAPDPPTTPDVPPSPRGRGRQ